jgi:hypothetical protein
MKKPIVVFLNAAESRNVNTLTDNGCSQVVGLAHNLMNLAGGKRTVFMSSSRGTQFQTAIKLSRLCRPDNEVDVVKNDVFALVENFGPKQWGLMWVEICKVPRETEFVVVVSHDQAVQEFPHFAGVQCGLGWQNQGAGNGQGWIFDHGERTIAHIGYSVE